MKRGDTRATRRRWFGASIALSAASTVLIIIGTLVSVLETVEKYGSIINPRLLALLSFYTISMASLASIAFTLFQFHVRNVESLCTCTDEQRAAKTASITMLTLLSLVVVASGFSIAYPTVIDEILTGSQGGTMSMATSAASCITAAGLLILLFWFAALNVED